MRDVIQRIIATESEARLIVDAARTEADRILSDARTKGKDIVERARQEGESRRKSHNVNIRVKITKIQKDIEKLQLENYSKCRALSDPHIFRDEETAKDYGRRLKEIEQELLLLDGKIKELEKQIK